MMASWFDARQTGKQAIMATIAGVRGSSYRGLGAQMLVIDDGARIGSVSGGCLEVDIARKAFWWLQNRDFYIKTYDTESTEDGFALGCGGAIDILIERLNDHDDDANPLMVAESVAKRREPVVVGTWLSSDSLGRRQVWRPSDFATKNPTGIDSAAQTAAEGRSVVALDGDEPVLLHVLEPPIHVLVCGAGFDAQPLVRFAASLGWTVTVVDRRPDFARVERFPEAARVKCIRQSEDLAEVCVDERTAVVVMSHSYVQDSFFLEVLGGRKPGYLGLMGARARTQSLLSELSARPSVDTMHAPAGLDLGADSPEEIGLSIVAEITACFRGRTGGNLRASGRALHPARA
jgi:xanthine dehydrogenase accessory factor